MSGLEQRPVRIGRVPALVWGGESRRVLMAVHGSQSGQTDAPIQLLAEAAVPRGYQVLSFDLPKHGERREEQTLCKVFDCVEDLRAVMDYARPRWETIGLFANSIGAYFSLMAYGGEALEQCLFLSPVVDMERLINNMMGWFHVTPERLEAEGEIPTPMGETLYWDYYQYVRAHPVLAWPCPTAILYGGGDALCEAHVVRDFADRFRCRLTVMERGEHYFHTPEELAFYRAWLEETLPPCLDHGA